MGLDAPEFFFKAISRSDIGQKRMGFDAPEFFFKAISRSDIGQKRMGLDAPEFFLFCSFPIKMEL